MNNLIVDRAGTGPIWFPPNEASAGMKRVGLRRGFCPRPLLILIPDQEKGEREIKIKSKIKIKIYHEQC